jgi:KaiC/GvpD/RAD55 family RecA-like ATPase
MLNKCIAVARERESVIETSASTRWECEKHSHINRAIFLHKFAIKAAPPWFARKALESERKNFLSSSRSLCLNFS